MNYQERYVRFLSSAFKLKRKLKIVIDCSNGVTGPVLHELLSKQPLIETVFLNDTVDGAFPAHGPNPFIAGAQNQLQETVRRIKADMGIIFDGDGDRVFFVDNQGQSIDPHEAAYILMQQFRGPYVIGAISSWRLRQKKAYVSRVGHYFFKQLMRKKKANLGLEHSGHYYFKKFFYCDSGIFAAIQVLNFTSKLDTSLLEWLEKLPRYYRSGEINFTVQNSDVTLNAFKKKYEPEAHSVSTLDGITVEFADWWCNLRSSNTEPLIRLNIEAKSRDELESRRKELIEFLKQF